MLKRLVIQNFKKFQEVEIELDRPVVFVGPNNSGKTTALQAIALWSIALSEWTAKRTPEIAPEKRPGININRKDLLAFPVTEANLLWRDRHTREKNSAGKGTKNIRIGVSVYGIHASKEWVCGFEFDFSNEETIACRPIRKPGFADKKVKDAEFLAVPEFLFRFKEGESPINIAYLQPMSGLAATEPKLESGRINVLIGEGQTAQVLRNLCHQICSREDKKSWIEICAHIKRLFGVEIHPPTHVPQRGEITMEYNDVNGITLDISSSGRGFQQTLLLLAYLYANPNSIILLDEPDAHLEILRQRQIFNLLTEIADKQGSQIIAATHSEVILQESAEKGLVVAFVGKPHVINNKTSEVMKALSEIGWEDYYKAEQKKWVLYTEGLTDFDILKTFAKKLEYKKAIEILENTPFIHPTGNNVPEAARKHFYGLRDAVQDLRGIALFDRLDKQLTQGQPLVEMMWKKREIENYFLCEDVLLNYAGYTKDNDDMFDLADAENRKTAMKEAIDEVAKALKTLGRNDIWSPDNKATDEVLEPIFKKYSEKLNLPLVLRKNEYYKLAEYLPKDSIDGEIKEKLDAIVKISDESKRNTNE